MSKDDKKDSKGSNSQVATADKWVCCEESQPEGKYSDGHPLDAVQYLEAKIILKPDRFVSVDSFRDFGKLVQRTAKDLKVGFITDP